MIPKDRILSEMQRVSAELGGKAPGARRFEALTGIRNADWFGKYWRNWGEALSEAGLTPNQLTGRIPDEELIKHCVDLAHDLGRSPVKGDIRIRRTKDPTFPNDKV